jgi:hypothetical protein
LAYKYNLIMARNLAIKCLRATRAALTTQAGSSNLLEGELYLITDEAVLAIGLTDSTYAECLMSGEQFWQKTGIVLSPKTANDKLEVSAEGVAIKGTSEYLSGVEGIGNDVGQAGVKGSGFYGGIFQGSAYGLSAFSEVGYGALIGSESHHNELLSLNKTTDEEDTITVINKIIHTSNEAAAGFGVYDSINITGATESARVVHRRTAATTVKREIWLLNSGSLTQAQQIDGSGQHTLNQYGSGTFTGTATKYLAVTSAGVVIEQAPPDESKWTKASTTLSPKTAGDKVEVTTTGKSAIKGTDATHVGVEGVSSGATTDSIGVKGSGVYGGSFSGSVYGMYATSAVIGISAVSAGTAVSAQGTGSGGAIAASNTSKTIETVRYGKVTDATNELQPVVIENVATTETAADGYGVYNSVELEAADGSAYEAYRRAVKWTDATAKTSSIELYCRRAGTWERKVNIAGSGQLTLDLYGAGTFTGTETKLLAVTSAGAVVETAIQGTATQKITYGTELTAAANLSRANHCFKETHFNKSSAANLTLLNADWLVGDWGVIRQIDEQATIVPEDATVIITGGTKTYGAGSALRFSCYKIDSGDKYFMIDGGSE